MVRFEKVFIKERLAPAVALSFQQRLPATSLHVSRNGNPSQVEQGGSQVNIERHLIDQGAGLGQPRIANQQWEADAFFVSRSLVAQAMLAYEVSLVGGEDDDGVVG